MYINERCFRDHFFQTAKMPHQKKYTKLSNTSLYGTLPVAATDMWNIVEKIPPPGFAMCTKSKYELLVLRECIAVCTERQPHNCYLRRAVTSRCTSSSSADISIIRKFIAETRDLQSLKYVWKLFEKLRVWWVLVHFSLGGYFWWMSATHICCAYANTRS